MVSILNYAVFLPSIVSVYNYLINKKLFDQLILESKPLPIEFGYGIYHIQFSIILAVAVVFGCFSIISLLKEKKDHWFFVLCILTLLNLISIHILSARTGLLAMYFGLLAVILGSIRSAGRRIKIYAITASVLIPVLLFISSTSLQNRLKNSIADLKVVLNKTDANDYSFAMRVAGWKNAADVIKHHTFSGVGIGDADEVLNKNFETFDPSIQAQNRRNPHLQFLETAVQSGLLSSFLFLLILWALIRSKQSASARFITIASVLLMFVSSCFESILESQASVVAFSLFLALAYQFKSEFKPVM